MATEPTERRKSTRLRRANVILDAEGVLHERLHSLRCSRQGHASVVSARVNEIIGLLSDDRNHQDVKEKLVYLATPTRSLRTLIVTIHLLYTTKAASRNVTSSCLEKRRKLIPFTEKSTTVLLILRANFWLPRFKLIPK